MAYDMYLTRSWNPDGPRPVVVEMGHLVRQLLEVVSLQARTVVNHYVVGGGYGTLSHMLTD